MLALEAVLLKLHAKLPPWWVLINFDLWGKLSQKYMQGVGALSRDYSTCCLPSCLLLLVTCRTDEGTQVDIGNCIINCIVASH